jgi:SHS2 domain-containing protein
MVPGARHEFIEHTAELALRLVAATPGELFAEACRALGAMFCAEAGCGTARTARTIRIMAVDAEALLVDLLNELIFLAETEQWAPLEAHAPQWSGTETVLELTGPRLDRAPSRIKSATHHGLTLRRDGGGWVAEVILDV